MRLIGNSVKRKDEKKNSQLEGTTFQLHHYTEEYGGYIVNHRGVQGLLL